MKLLIATTNIGKRKELLDLLKGLSIEVVTPTQLGLTLDVDESGQTYAENACLKAQAFFDASRLVTLADDTGLEVDALGGRPGVHSARYVEKPGATDADRRAKLLSELSAFPRPWKAHFHCTVAVAASTAEIHLLRGTYTEKSSHMKVERTVLVMTVWFTFLKQGRPWRIVRWKKRIASATGPSRSKKRSRIYCL